MGFSSPPSPFGMMRSPAFPPRRPSALLRYIIPVALILMCFYNLTTPDSVLLPSSGKPASAPPSKTPQDNAEHSPAEHTTSVVAKPTTTSAIAASLPTGNHPIDNLIRAAEKEFEDKLAKESKSLSDAAAAYRKRRGRHPPPGFKEWYEFAKEHNAIMVEDFWDQIYHDLGPFWALSPALIRKEAWDFEMTIHVRNGNATAGSDWFWTQLWLSMIKTVEHLLPDMSLSLNAMDEPRLVVPWEQINQYMGEAEKKRSMPDPKDVVSEFQRLAAPGEGPDKDVESRNKEWEKTKPYWLVARRGCAPDSAARKADSMTQFNMTPTISATYAASHMKHGYVSNYTMSTEFCHQPDLQGLSGIFVEPLSVSATKVLFPMFGGSKLAVNNEILLPAPMYWSEEERFTGKSSNQVPWDKKKDGVVWRGVATGGRNREDNWKAFQRHRFVAMNNGTKITRAEEWTELPNNWAMPSSSYGLKAQEEGQLGEWVDTWANVGFVDLMCLPQKEDLTCNYTSPYFAVTPGMEMAEQFKYKYLPDIDGNSFSGRYLGFLRSTSLPVKATLWREWHDSRLVAWKHFVPMDNRYSDYYGIMEYFLGYKDKVPAHDAEAKKIAMAGREWADKALRKEDMQVYVLRLLLEYARVTDERREKMGWVEDLL
ncbi:hypothetical protein QBC46DRAFT_59525 [Diplogelasinospora grovesii]|uniref:Glycosyl transferase CAP10 domain-containing protein n=1 Tax=Diplogelasinospora grovesii TaxID=303347 RepID=A0AAN6MZZ3_9PEZI|nr:hypothetical protein QBC46DRAFT_59525 [Diplogelasinospora grovesii]